MAKNDNLTHYLTDIANTIREINGTTDLINAQNFTNEITKSGKLTKEIEEIWNIILNESFNEDFSKDFAIK